MFQWTYELSENDYYEFNRFHMYHAPMSKKTVWVGRFLPPACYMLIAFVFFRATHSWTYVYTFGVVSIAFVLFYRQICDASLRRRLKRIKKHGKLPFESRVSLEATDDHIVERADSGEKKTCLAQCEYVLAGHSAVYVYNSALSAYIIPNRVFRDEDEKNRFIRFIESKIDKPRQAIP